LKELLEGDKGKRKEATSEETLAKKKPKRVGFNRNDKSKA